MIQAQAILRTLRGLQHSRKCISYLTIELREGEIPSALRPGVSPHLFGCDICQDVCPWNRRAPVTEADEFQARPGLFWPELDRLFDLQEEEWRLMIRGTAMKRAKIKGLLKNLMVVAGNSGLKRFLPKVRQFLDHEDPVVRSHARWAADTLERSGSAEMDETALKNVFPETPNHGNFR